MFLRSPKLSEPPLADATLAPLRPFMGSRFPFRSCRLPFKGTCHDPMKIMWLLIVSFQIPRRRGSLSRSSHCALPSRRDAGCQEPSSGSLAVASLLGSSLGSSGVGPEVSGCCVGILAGIWAEGLVFLGCWGPPKRQGLRVQRYEHRGQCRYSCMVKRKRRKRWRRRASRRQQQEAAVAAGAAAAEAEVDEGFLILTTGTVIARNPTFGNKSFHQSDGRQQRGCY